MVKWVYEPDETGPANRVGTRMMHLGIGALLARKGVKTTQNKGIDVKYTWRKVGKRTEGDANSFRLQPFGNSDFFDTDDQYMKLRNFSFNVYKQDWSGQSSSRPRGKETERQTAARHLWTGAYPGADMQHYRIRGMEGAEDLMNNQKLLYKEQGMEMIMRSLTRAMLRDFIKVMGNSGTWKAAVDKAGKNVGKYKPDQTEFELGSAPPSLKHKLKFHKTRRGGLPVIGADSTEEAQLYILNAFMKEKIDFALEGKEIDVQTGMILAGRRGTKRMPSQRLDISRKKQSYVFKEITDFLMQKGVAASKKNMIQWEKDVGNWTSKIAGYDIGEQKLSVRFAKEWDTFSKKNDMKAIKDLNDLKKFISFIAQKAQNYKVSEAGGNRGDALAEIRRLQKASSRMPSIGFMGGLTPADVRPGGKYFEEWIKAGGSVRDVDILRLQEDSSMRPRIGGGRTGDLGQFARRLRQLKKKSYIFTQPLGSGRAIILVQELNDVPTFTVGYIDGPNDDLGTAVTKYLIGDGRESRFRATLRYLAEGGYASYRNEGLRITESLSEKGFFYYGAARYGDFVTTTTMVMPRVLAAALKEWIDEACGQWWSDSSWDRVFDPDEMKGFGFAQWFRYWIEMSKKAAFQIDNRTGTPGWAGWLRKTVTPKYKREGRDRPKGTRPPSKMMPYTGGKEGPRAWHSPLYARPFFVQDNWGKKQAAARESGDYAAYIKMQKELESSLPADERTPGGPRWLKGMKL